MYLDVNNLYGYAMMKSLPLNGFKWCDDDILKIKILKMIQTPGTF